MKVKLNIAIGLIYMAALVQTAASQSMRMKQGGMQPGSPRMGTMNNLAAMPEFEPVKMASINIHNSEKVIKKIKVKDDDRKLRIYRLIGQHNIKMNELVTDNQSFFDEMKLTMNAAMKSRDREMMVEVRKIYSPRMTEIRKQAKVLNEDLKTQVSAGLSDKQLKKWENYLKQIESETNQSMPNRNSNQRSQNGPRSGGMRRY